MGKMRSSDDAADPPVSRKEAWLDNNPTRLLSSSPAPNHKPASSPPSKPIRTKRTPYSLIAPPPPGPTLQHGIQGTLRHPDFQHNGEQQSNMRPMGQNRPAEGSSLAHFPYSFLPSFLPSFLSYFPSFFPSFLPSFFHSFLPSSLYSFRLSFLPSFLPSFYLSFLP